MKRTAEPKLAVDLIRWLPGPMAVLFFALLFLALIKPTIPLTDQATGRHLATGKIILEAGQLPHMEKLNYLYPNDQTVNLEWLFDVASRLIINYGDLGVYVYLVFVLYALTICLFFKHLLDQKMTLITAVTAAVLLACANYVHLLARPVIVTYFFFVLVMMIWQRILNGECEKRHFWILPVIFLIWANVHPGFTASIVYMGLSLAGLWCDGKNKNVRIFRSACLSITLNLLVTLINPIGWGLHGMIAHQVLNSRSLSYVQEFLPPDFTKPNAAILVFEIVLLVGFLFGIRRKESFCFKDIFPIFFFLFFALRAQRHILLFLPVTIPLLVAAVDDWLKKVLSTDIKKRIQVYTKMANDVRFEYAWMLVGITITGLLFLSLDSKNLRIGGKAFSAEAEEAIREYKHCLKRPFTSSIVAGNLLYYYPEIKVSFDDRVDFYQDKKTFEHLEAINMIGDWKLFLETNAFDSAILATTDPLSEGLRTIPNWQEMYRDSFLVLWLRMGIPEKPTIQKVK
jgi:hypothetical protein